MYGAIPLLDKEVRFADSDGVHRTPEIGGDRGWSTWSICPVPHHPLIPSLAEKGSYFRGREVDFKPGGERSSKRRTNMALANDFLLVLHFLMPSWNFMLAWLPLQKGLLSEAPHRHNVTRLRAS